MCADTSCWRRDASTRCRCKKKAHVRDVWNCLATVMLPSSAFTCAWVRVNFPLRGIGRSGRHSCVVNCIFQAETWLPGLTTENRAGYDMTISLRRKSQHCQRWCTPQSSALSIPLSPSRDRTGSVGRSPYPTRTVSGSSSWNGHIRKMCV